MSAQQITLRIDAMDPEALRDELPPTVTMKQTGVFVGMGSEMVELTGPRECIADVVAIHWGLDELPQHPELAEIGRRHFRVFQSRQRFKNPSRR